MLWLGAALLAATFVPVTGATAYPYGPVTFDDVVGIGPDLAWAVGTRQDTTGASSTLTERWDGSAWTVIDSPNPGGWFNSLAAVDALGPRSVWAVGTATRPYHDTPLVLHWNGSAWDRIHAPMYGGDDLRLFEIEVRSPTNVWVVGTWSTRDNPKGIVMRWDGSRWWRLPWLPGHEGTYGMSSGGNGTWALGIYSIWRWNGSGWKQLPPLPSLGARTILPSAIAPVTSCGSCPRGIWVAGASWYDPGSDQGPRFYVARWNGARWSLPVSTGGGWLADIDAAPHGRVWVVGQTRPGFNSALLTRTAGGWTQMHAAAAINEDYLAGVDARAADDVWAVGWHEEQPLAMHWDGSAWTLTRTPSV